jgi:NAD+-dependent protein deacetylase sirtuin 4
MLTSEAELHEKIQQVAEWMVSTKKKKKTSVLCLTGAGVSTESGVPDYRGHNGAYLRGHRPMLHEQFVSSHVNRQRYWGRGMVGWRSFRDRQPNRGHAALAHLERMGRMGVALEDSPEFYRHGDSDVNFAFGSGQRTLSIITQNVDSLHQRAGSKHVLDLHGRTDQVRCMHCGATSCRNEFHDELERINADWLSEALRKVQTGDLRPDGDAETRDADYSGLRIPECHECGVGFVKPDVVFFGDTVPRHRVAQCSAAVDRADGLLVVGTSLAVHSAFRHVRTASQMGTPICIVNVGETRAETEGLHGILKVEAPAGPTLAGVADYLASREIA